MNCLVTLILLFVGCSFISSSQYPLRTYYYVNLKVTWADAQQYCREKYTDLATIESGDDISMLKPNISYSWAWIGLKDDPASWKVTMGNDQNSWRWSATGETSKTGYQSWNVSEPGSGSGKENCVKMDEAGAWHDVSCEMSYRFVCYTDTDQKEKIYEFVSTPKTWHSARDYCREYHTDLPMIEDSVENNEVVSAKPADAEIWIGLYRVPWVWSDMSPSTFRYWRSGSPNNYGGRQFCMAENNNHEWDDDVCDVQFVFICHEVSKLQTVLRMTTETDADMTDSNINSQLLEKLDEVLRRQGWTSFTLRWKTLPRKLREKDV
ncbi:hypothetical protein INR49_028564 [Caranx melampygus]|nr:hypothetical protein INR49_028564 [Caranx melampygus]